MRRKSPNSTSSSVTAASSTARAHQLLIASVAVKGDRVVAVGPLPDATARETIDASGLVVAPGFINMLSWADEPLLVDPRSQSDIRQGVTLEVFGEGWSMGPLNERMKAEQLAAQGDLKFAIDWTTLGEYLQGLERRGISPNVASLRRRDDGAHSRNRL